jgi:LacI family transcriptional regulator
VPTIYDVARRAQVSAATVSRVLNGSNSVDPALAHRVNAAVAELGYRRNEMARNLRRRQSSLWAMIISDVTNPFFTSMVRGVEDVASSAGYSVVLCNSDEHAEKESSYIAAAMAEQMAGVLISPSSNRIDGVSLLMEAKCPVVVIDRELQGFHGDTVLVDNEEGAHKATEHLVAQGYERIACITGPRWLSTALGRLRGYQHALAADKRPLDDALVRHSDFRERGGYDAMASLLDGGALPDAVFVTNNLMTVGALECLADRGLAVPRDIGIVGFDDIPWAHLVRPTLTTVVQPTYEIGMTGAQLLLRRIEDVNTEPRRILLSTELRCRDSSTRP